MINFYLRIFGYVCSCVPSAFPFLKDFQKNDILIKIKMIACSANSFIFYFSLFLIFFAFDVYSIPKLINYVENIQVVTYAGKVGSSDSIDGNLLYSTFSSPLGMCMDEHKKYLYVVDQGSLKLRIIDITKGEVKTAASSKLFRNLCIFANYELDVFIKPSACAVDSNSNVFVTDQYRIIASDIAIPLNPPMFGVLTL